MEGVQQGPVLVGTFFMVAECQTIAFHLSLCGVTYTTDRRSSHTRVERVTTGVHWGAADASAALHVPG